MARTTALNVQPHDPASLVRYGVYAAAAAAALPLQELARRLGMSPSALTYRLQQSSFEKADSEVKLFLERLDGALGHTDGNLVRLWRQNLPVGDRPEVVAPATWWESLRDLTHYRAPLDVIVAAQSLARHLRLNDAVELSTLRSVDAVDHAAAAPVIEGCCRLISGPYGRTRTALDLLALLTPLRPDVVARFVDQSPVSFKILRALDRAMRRWSTTATMMQTLWGLAQRTIERRPPELWYSWDLRTTRRAVRTGAVDDIDAALDVFRRAADPDVGLPSRARYAVWCAAEIGTPAGLQLYEELRSRYRTHPELEDLFAFLGTRRQLATRLQQIPDGDLVQVRLELEHSAPPLRRLLERQLPAALRSLNAQIREPTITIVQELLTTACAIRRSSLCGALQASGEAVRATVSTACAALADEAATLAEAGAPIYVAENATFVIGAMQHDEGIDQLTGLAQRSDLGQGLRQSLAYRFGDVLAIPAHRIHPGFETARSELVEQFSRPDQPDGVRWAATHALGVIRTDKNRQRLAEIQRDDPSAHCRSMAGWGWALLDDPLLGRARR